MGDNRGITHAVIFQIFFHSDLFKNINVWTENIYKLFTVNKMHFVYRGFSIIFILSNNILFRSETTLIEILDNTHELLYSLFLV